MSSERRLRALTAIGSDRPGLVKSISAVVRQHDASIEDSRMAILGGEFAMILLCSGSAENLAALEAAVAPLADELGLTLTFKETGRPSARDHVGYLLQVSGMDRPGIVHAVTDILAQREVNIASLDTHLVHLPMSGTPTFVLEASLQLPAKTSIPELRRELGRVCDAENLDFSLEPGI